MKLTKAEIVERVASDLAERKLSQRVDFSTARVAVIRGKDRTLANVMAAVPELRDSPDKLFDFIREVHKTVALPPIVGRKPGDRPPEPRGTPQGEQQQQSPQEQSPAQGFSGAGQAEGPARSSPAARAGAEAGVESQATPPTAFRLRAASANWLSSSTKFIGGGGPGARPVGVLPVTARSTSPQPWAFTMPAGLDRPGSGEATRLVEVAVLDTVPSLAALQLAHTNRVVNQTPPHPLLELLLSSASGAFNVVDRTLATSSPGTVDQLEVWYNPAIAPVVLAEQDYTMSSHGLFIAGIIRSIAPQVKLRLIQVLNDDGGGSLQNLLDGFELLTDRDEEDDTPLLVNASLMLNVTPEGEDVEQLMQDIFAIVNQSNAAVIAAAGNEGNIASGTHPDAEAPAAYDTVTGVAALKRDNATPAEYSNKADTPIVDGFAAYGGEIALGASPITADANTGILGAFIDELPGSLPNATGWVRWAGTSFATPIVTAALANMLSREANTDDALEAVGDLLGELPAGAIGDVLGATQG